MFPINLGLCLKIISHLLDHLIINVAEDNGFDDYVEDNADINFQQILLH